MTLSSPSSIRRTGSRSLVVIIELVAYMWILVVAIIFRARCGLLRGCGDDCEPCKSGRSWCWSGCDSSGPKELCIRWGSKLLWPLVCTSLALRWGFGVAVCIFTFKRFVHFSTQKLHGGCSLNLTPTWIWVLRSLESEVVLIVCRSDGNSV